MSEARYLGSADVLHIAYPIELHHLKIAKLCAWFTRTRLNTRAVRNLPDMRQVPEECTGLMHNKPSGSPISMNCAVDTHGLPDKGSISVNLCMA
jgi:hypothetical protein